MFSPKKGWGVRGDVMDVSINLTGGIFSQYTCITNNHIVYFKYIIILFFLLYLNNAGEEGKEPSSLSQNF